MSKIIRHASRRQKGGTKYQYKVTFNGAPYPTFVPNSTTPLLRLPSRVVLFQRQTGCLDWFTLSIVARRQPFVVKWDNSLYSLSNGVECIGMGIGAGRKDSHIDEFSVNTKTLLKLLEWQMTRERAQKTSLRSESKLQLTWKKVVTAGQPRVRERR